MKNTQLTSTYIYICIFLTFSTFAFAQSQTAKHNKGSAKQSNGSNISIFIYDINGNQVKTLSSRINKGLNTYDINISEFNSGAFLYAIVVDGIKFKTNKFIINK